MFNWTNKQFVPFPKEVTWAEHSVLQPTPILLNEDVIRIYCGMRQVSGVSQAGYIDVSSADPSKVLGVSKAPVLTEGQDGMFDENGVVPCSVIRDGDKIYMYYAGYQLGHKIKFYVFSGLAVSTDGGETFERVQSVPVMERSHQEPFFRVVHTMMPDGEGGYHAWYGAGGSFVDGEKAPRPVYDVKYAHLANLTDFPKVGETVLTLDENETRVGRPYVRRTANGFAMLYGFETIGEPYKLGYAISADGKAWTRKDDELNLDKEHPEELSMQGYPALLNTPHGEYLFYNGNDYGKKGFYCCKLESTDCPLVK